MKFLKEMRSSLAAVLVVLVFAAGVHGEDEIRVRVINRDSGPCDGSITDLFFDAGADFTINISSCAELVNIFDSNNNQVLDNIGRVTINGLVSTGNTLGVKIGAGSFPINTNSFTTACHDFGGLTFTDSQQAGRTKFAGHIGGDLTDSIDVNALILFEVDGAILDNVRSDIGSSGFFHVIAGSVGQDASIICTNANIDLVRIAGDMVGAIESVNQSISVVIVGGDLLGDVLATKLEIGDITVTGDIGSPGNPVTITAGKDGTTNQEFNSIGTIQASAIWANITANALDRGDIKQLITTSGDFVGTLTTDSIQGTLTSIPALDIKGDLDADIFAAGSVKRPIVIGGILPVGRIIRIGGDLKNDTGSDFEIDFAMANGLQGQIVINASNTGKLWSGVIRVGGPDENPITLSPTPSYDNLPSTIGGGAVGLGPFKFHAKACDPVHQAIIITGPGTPPTPAPSEAKMEFYGELIDNSGANEPVTVERKSFVGSPPPPLDWVDVTSNYTITVSGRVVTVTPKSGQSFGPNFRYKITPVAGRLSSKDVDGTPDVDDSEYLFDVEAAGPGI